MDEFVANVKCNPHFIVSQIENVKKWKGTKTNDVSSGPNVVLFASGSPLPLARLAILTDKYVCCIVNLKKRQT